VSDPPGVYCDATAGTGGVSGAVGHSGGSGDTDFNPAPSGLKVTVNKPGAPSLLT